MARVVVLDVDGTLVDLVPAIEVGLDAVLDELRDLTPAADRLTVEDLQADCGFVHAALPGASVEEFRRAGFARSLIRLGLDPNELLDRITDLFFASRYAAVRLFDDVRPALAALRPSYVVGVASNGNSYVHHCGLGGEFAFEVYAHIDGLRPKPDPAFFARVAAEAGVPPHEIVHVGDSLDHDVIAAQRAGLQAIWLNRSGEPVRPDAQPDAVISTLAGLPVVLTGARFAELTGARLRERGAPAL
jgi:FMN hydrolase / 5-amino-6-(5-phospho-D-ribitylamino)uracil phosphatase